MDPSSLVSQTPIPEIWQFPLVDAPLSLKINGRDSSVAESTVTDHSGGTRGRRRRRYSAPPSEDESSKIMSTSSGNDATDSEAKRVKGMKCSESKTEPSEEATDSHSLAERARREKISERMKILQDLVPGCNKVTGKASVLDEIINYIQALQRQVEFLSIKLEAVKRMISNPRH